MTLDRPVRPCSCPRCSTLLRDESGSIATGTLCWVIWTSPGNEELLGRVVEVISPALPMPERGDVAMHEIDAAWLRAEHPGFHCFAQPPQLRPIAGPGMPPVVTRKREPEQV
jgi:hypothetical protein